MTHKEWLACVALLAAAYPKEPMTKAQILLYEELLRDYPAEAVRHAVLRHIADSPWFPRVSELRARLADAADGEEDGEHAWGVVQDAVRRVGAYGQPTWSDPVIAETMAALGWVGAGWVDFCRSEHVEADRAHFVQWYRQTRRRRKLRRDEADTVTALASMGVDLRAIGQGPKAPEGPHGSA